MPGHLGMMTRTTARQDDHGHHEAEHEDRHYRGEDHEGPEQRVDLLGGGHARDDLIARASRLPCKGCTYLIICGIVNCFYAARSPVQFVGLALQNGSWQPV